MDVLGFRLEIAAVQLQSRQNKSNPCKFRLTQTCVQKPQWEAFGCRAHNVCLFILNQTDFDIVQTPGNKTPQMFSTHFCIFNSPLCTFLRAGGIFKHALLAASAHSKHLLCCWKINAPLFECFSAARGRARCQKPAATTGANNRRNVPPLLSCLFQRAPHGRMAASWLAR